MSKWRDTHLKNIEVALAKKLGYPPSKKQIEKAFSDEMRRRQSLGVMKQREQYEDFSAEMRRRGEQRWKQS